MNLYIVHNSYAIFRIFFIKICKICLYIVLQNREENFPSLRQVRLINRTADQSAVYVNITCIYISLEHVVQLNRKMKYLYIHLQTKHVIILSWMTCLTIRLHTLFDWLVVFTWRKWNTNQLFHQCDLSNVMKWHKMCTILACAGRTL